MYLKPISQVTLDKDLLLNFLINDLTQTPHPHPVHSRVGYGRLTQGCLQVDCRGHRGIKPGTFSQVYRYGYV